MDTSHLSDHVVLKTISETSTEGVFAIEGLEAGYGLTIGTALRRVLLTSLPGAAVTMIKIKGATHEFSTFPGLQEDLVDFSLNFKKLRFTSHAAEPVVLTLHKKGEGVVTGGDIKLNSDVELANPDFVLGHLTTKSADLNVELTVERGMGYVSSEAHHQEKLPVGAIGIDAIFSPVITVNVTVEDMRVGKRTDFNRVKLDVETDGTVSPSAAIAEASKVLQSHFERLLAKSEVTE
jgi:DNA-directed RNA polymerase subunit alpha